MRFDGKRALVTGAGKGIGEATAKMLAARGATVVALSRSQDDLDALKEAIACETVTVDLADAEAARAAARAVPPIDLLANNAGTTELAGFLETSVETFDRIMAVNARAAMIVAQECARSMIARHVPGAIVNVASLAAEVGIAEHTAYSASKGAMDAMGRVMAKELGPHGIRVNTINPIVTLTAMAKKAWSDEAKAESMLSRIPIRRFATPEDVAEVICYLLGDGATMVNGVTLLVDGGFRAI